MTKNYTQFSLVQRYQIEAFNKAGMKQKFIAVQVGVHPSTISRELNRNIASRGRTAGLYSAERAQKKAQTRHEEKPKLIKFDTKLEETAAAMLIEKKWSPELISRSGDCLVSHEIIYRGFGGVNMGTNKGKRNSRISTST